METKSKGAPWAGLAFGFSYAAYAALTLVTASQLPERVASHFAADGRANDWMSRQGYLFFQLFFPLFVGLSLLGTAALVRWLPARYVNLPRKDFWLAPARREQACALLLRFMAALASLMMLFFGGLHLLILEANRARPPQLPTCGMLCAVAAFLLALTLWIIALVRRFAETGEGQSGVSSPQKAQARTGCRARKED